MALAAGIRDNRATAEMIKTFEVVNRMVCRIKYTLDSVETRERSGLGKNQADGAD